MLRKFSLQDRKGRYAVNTGRSEKYYQWFQKHWIDMLVWTYVLFVIYTTAVPFRFHLNIEYLHNRLPEIEWAPFYFHGHWASRADMVANVIFFIPLGLLLALRKILRNYRLFSLVDWLGIVATGMGLSLFVEFLQIFSVTRSPSLTDVLTNTMGTIIGALSLEFIYWRFHQVLKHWLFLLFHRKPEMIISALLLIIIFIAQSVPFTFQLSLQSIQHQIQEFVREPFRLDYPVSDLLTNALLYGSWSYFLFVGIHRYHHTRLRGTLFWVLVATVFLLPVGLEAFQLLIPDRNHSLADVLLATEGIVLGMILWKIQERPGPWHLYDKDPLERHIVYFRVITVVYWLFLFNRLFLPIDPVTHTSALTHLIVTRSHHLFHLVERDRLEFLLSLAKEVFAFVPAGFVISFWWYRRRREFMSIVHSAMTMLLLPVILLILSAFLARRDINAFRLMAGIIGTGVGFGLWHIFYMMMAKIPYEK